MEPLFIVATGVMAAVSAYLLMSRNVLRMVLGLLLLGNVANLTIFIAGRLRSAVPPLVAAGETTIAQSANPLPQALILTAIVIGFGVLAFSLVLAHGVHQSLGTDDVDDIRTGMGR